MGKCEKVTSVDWTHLQNEVRSLELCSMNPQSSEETLGASHSPVNSAYLVGPLDWHARYEPSGELLVAEVDVEATSVNSKPIHLVGTPPVFLNRIQASDPTSGDGRVATAGYCKPLARPIMSSESVIRAYGTC